MLVSIYQSIRVFVETSAIVGVKLRRLFFPDNPVERTEKDSENNTNS